MLLDAPVLEGPCLLLGLHPADAILLEQLASDASADVLPDEAADAARPALAAVPYAEKLVAQAQAVLALVEKCSSARRSRRRQRRFVYRAGASLRHDHPRGGCDRCCGLRGGCRLHLRNITGGGVPLAEH